MKNRIIIAIHIIFISLLMIACSDVNAPQQDSSEYYVRYSISSYPAVFDNVTYADVNATKTDHLTRRSSSWTVTIGPVKKGFQAYVENDGGPATDKIEVSKNNGPFALKATGTNSVSYTIDY